jgi:flavin-dependent dehydrogenase
MQTYQAKFLVGADGVNSIVRKKILGPIPKQDLGICYGCFATSNKKEVTRIKYFEDIKGYAWCFPRHDHLSIGIGMAEGDTKKIKKIFNDFITSYYPDINIKSKWGAKIPIIKNPHFYDLPCADDNWMLIGDAAGHVDPITGEGISYALWSAELAAKAILKKDPKSFNEMWKKEYGDTLRTSCTSRDFFYNPKLLEYSIKLASKSKTFSTFLYEYTMNQIPSKDLIKRIIKDISKITKEYIFSSLRS